jgi:hypothetical protein
MSIVNCNELCNAIGVGGGQAFGALLSLARLRAVSAHRAPRDVFRAAYSRGQGLRPCKPDEKGKSSTLTRLDLDKKTGPGATQATCGNAGKFYEPYIGQSR